MLEPKPIFLTCGNQMKNKKIPHSRQ